MSLTVKQHDKVWRVIITGEVWEVQSEKGLLSLLQHLVEMKNKFRPVEKQPYDPQA